MSGLNERARLQIALLAGDDLEGEQVEEAQRNVESCPHCREHWVRVRGCLDVLERVGKSAGPVHGPSLWPAVESRLRPMVIARRSETFNGWVPALSMAAACIALLIAGQMDGVAPEDVVLTSQEEVVDATLSNWPGADDIPEWPPVETRNGLGLQYSGSPFSIKEVLLPPRSQPFPEQMR